MEQGLGQSTCIGIGGDPVNGLKHLDVMKLFNDDDETDAVLMVGEIGGSDEEDCARWVRDNMRKPVVGFHRRPYRSAGQAHGACGSGYFGRQGHGAGEAGSDGGVWDQGNP